MGRLETFSVPGCRCWFYSGDHGPPHFHAGAPGEWEVRVFFLQDPVMYEVKYMLRRIPRGLLTAILEGAQEHRAAVFREWERSQADE